MEYGTKIDAPEIHDSNFMRYVGYSENNDCIKKFFSQETINLISRKVTELTMGVNPENRPIVVPDSTISNIMSNVQQNYRRPHLLSHRVQLGAFILVPRL